MKIKSELRKILKDKNFTTKIKLYYSYKYMGDDYDPEENNLSERELNPITVKGLVKEISPEALVWKQYGLSEIGAVEIITDAKNKAKFEICSKVEIDGEEYQVFKEASGNNALIQKYEMGLVRIVLRRDS